MRKFDYANWIARQRSAMRGVVAGISLAVLATGIVAPAWAQYTIGWFTVAGGGATQDSGGPYTLGATIGQPAAGLMTGGSYSLGSGFWGGGSATVGIEPGDDEAAALPLSFRLHAATPNPLVHRTAVAFDLPQARSVRVLLYDAAGRLMRTLADGLLPAGRYQRVWDGADDGGRKLAAGIYFVRFDAGTFQARQKIVLLR